MKSGCDGMEASDKIQEQQVSRHWDEMELQDLHLRISVILWFNLHGVI